MFRNSYGDSRSPEKDIITWQFVTKEVSGEYYGTISKIIPMNNYIYSQTEKNEKHTIQ